MQGSHEVGVDGEKIPLDGGRERGAEQYRGVERLEKNLLSESGCRRVCEV
jgi:hypothetical protein